MNAPEAYPQGYVEDAFKARTKLAAFFSSRRTQTASTLSNNNSPFIFG